MLLLSAVALAGCRQEAITVYDVPKEFDAAQAQIQWAAPPGWQEQPADRMAMVNYSIPGESGRTAGFSIMEFPGVNAGAIELINVVRGDAGLPPLPEEEFSRVAEQVSVGGDKGLLIDFTGATNSSNSPTANRIMLTVLQRDGMTWLFKLAGDASVVTAQKSALLGLLKSVSFAGGGQSVPARAPQFTSTNTKLTPREPAPAESPNAPAPAAGKPAWEIPPGWREVAGSEMLLAKFAVGGQDGQAEVTVSSFPGEVGGLLANVNRWRGQVGLPPIAAEDLEKTVSTFDVIGGRASLVDVNGHAAAQGGKETRIVGVIWPRSGQTWFYKMMGDSATTEREKDVFLKFVQSVRFPNG